MPAVTHKCSYNNYIYLHAINLFSPPMTLNGASVFLGTYSNSAINMLLLLSVAPKIRSLYCIVSCNCSHRTRKASTPFSNEQQIIINCLLWHDYLYFAQFIGQFNAYKLVANILLNNRCASLMWTAKFICFYFQCCAPNINLLN